LRAVAPDHAVGLRPSAPFWQPTRATCDGAPSRAQTTGRQWKSCGRSFWKTPAKQIGPGLAGPMGSSWTEFYRAGLRPCPPAEIPFNTRTIVQQNTLLRMKAYKTSGS
jgi:hypothetical protein